MRQETLSFISFGQAEAGLIFDDSNHENYPIRYFNIINGKGLTTEKDKSYHVFVYSGEALLKTETDTSCICPKDVYFSVHGNFCLTGTFKAIAIEIHTQKGKFKQNSYRAYTHIGGPVEATGRLKYIDGCTDSLLIPPVKKGDPCLNHLHFPKNIRQTPHTHPSHRIGIVINGEGECVTPFGNLPLVEGCIFVIKEYAGTEKAEGLDGLYYEAGTHKLIS